MKMNAAYDRRLEFLEKLRDFFRENDLVLEFDITYLDELEINIRSDKNDLKFKTYGQTLSYEDFNYLINELIETEGLKSERGNKDGDLRLRHLRLRKNKNRRFFKLFSRNSAKSI